MDEQIDILEAENKKLKLEIKKLNRQLNLANDNLTKHKNVTSAKENLSAVIAAEKTRQEKQLQVIMENTPDLVILLDHALYFLLSTQSFLHLAGIPGLGFLHHKSFRQVFSPFCGDAWLDKMEGILNSVLQSNEALTFDEELCIGPSGNVRTYAVSIIPFNNGDENDGLLVNYHDMTDRIEMENRIKDALNDATAASKAKGDFLANMSHEIRTPMNAIIGMTNIGRSADSVEQKDYSLDRIGDASKHLLGIINDILDMSKIEAGKFELSETLFDFERMFQQVANVISFRAEEKQHKFTVYIDRAIPQNMVGDDQRLAQVITNLVSNSIKFTPDEGAIRVHTYYMGEEDGVCTMKIAVTDTGIGIDPEHHATLFQSFQQAESSTSRKFGGTGLGLTISKSIIEMMGGEIWVDSELGKGSTFTFTVKVKRGASKQQKFIAPEADMQDIRVLAVDDDSYILEDFKGIIEGLGLQCDTAMRGEDALRLVEENGAYNIYFVDWKLSDMSSVELIKELRARMSSEKDSLVIMVSFFEYSTVVDEAKKSGVDKFLQKPLFPSTITSLIDEYLGAPEYSAEEEGDDISAVFEGHSVLLAEDVDINREIVMTLLEPTLLSIDCAENGEEAVRMFSESPEKYEMIFMDVQMPEMDGYEATRRIRKLSAPSAGTVPIVAMTANVFKEDIEKCLESGMNDHIGKPLDFDEVMNMLRTYLVL